MEKRIEFLLEYAKIGVLEKMTNVDKIEAEELKEKYLEIKKSFSEEMPKKEEKGKKKDGKFNNWLSGIGERQKAYEEKHKNNL
jgi:hypothetical protein